MCVYIYVYKYTYISIYTNVSKCRYTHLAKIYMCVYI